MTAGEERLWEVRLQLQSLQGGHPEGTAQWAGASPVAFSGWLELARLLELSDSGSGNDITTNSERTEG
jgi:hypothetical protein